MNSHDVFVFKCPITNLELSYLLLCGEAYIISFDELLEIQDEIESVSKFQNLISSGRPWQVYRGLFKNLEYLGRLSEELIEDILFMEELGK